MDHADHVALLRGGIERPGGTWADFGAGTGAFTLALAELVGADAEIFVIDWDARALRVNERAMKERFEHTRVHYQVADLTKPLEVRPLDGSVMANALHFQRDHQAVVGLLRQRLRPGGRMLIVEYNLARPNAAVPHPVPFERWEELAREAGFGHTELLAKRPSRFLHEIYSAVSW
jgi:SAM-dependent methyltransferase